MRKLQILIFFLLTFAACENREPDPVITPVWLEARIAGLEEGGCQGCSVKRYTYKEEYFFHVYCNYWSCYDCEIYRYDGTLVDWEIINHQDFDKNKARPILIWECNTEETGE